MKNKIPPPILTLVFALIAIGVDIVLPQFFFAFGGQKIIAIGILVIAISIMLIAFFQFMQRKTTVNPLTPKAATHLVTSGVMGLSRNPMYLGMLLILVAVIIAIGNYIAIFLLPLFVLTMNKLQIEPEEAALRENFGTEFEDYCSNVRRWM